MTWCEKKGQVCPVPEMLAKLKSGGLNLDEVNERGLENSRDEKLVSMLVPLVEYLGYRGTCDGVDTWPYDTDGAKEFASCLHPFRSEIDAITYTAFSINLTSSVRPLSES